MAKRESAPDYFWLEPLRVLLNETALFHPVFVWWHNLIGGSQGQSLFHTETFCTFEDPFAPAWTIENFIEYGPNEVLRLWALKEMHDLYCESDGGGG